MTPRKSIRIFLSALFFVLLTSFAWSADAARTPSVILPVQVTYETEPVLSMAVSKDGKWVVYASGGENSSDLWITPSDPSVTALPRQLTFDPFSESFPSFSPDGNLLAFVGTSHDVKGDIYLLDLQDEKNRPLRLTGRKGGEGGPSFSPDGKRLYFHRTGKDGAGNRIVFIDLSSIKKEMKDGDRRAIEPDLHDTGVRGTFPVISPSGDRMACINYENNSGGSLNVIDLNGFKRIFSVEERSPKLFPSWSPDGKCLYYTAFLSDTDKDGSLTLKDAGSVIRISPETGIKYLMTPLIYSALNPHAAGSSLFFLSDKGGVMNGWLQPMEGQIPQMDRVEDQLILAENMEKRVPYSPSMTLLSYYRVMDHRAGTEESTAQAAYAIGTIYRSIDMRHMGLLLLDHSIPLCKEERPVKSLSRILREAIRVEIALARNEKAEEKNREVRKTVAALESLKKNAHPLVRGKAAIEQARLILRATDLPYTLALEKIEEAASLQGAGKLLIAEAMIEKGGIFEKLGERERVIPVYTDILLRYPDASPFSEMAAEKIIDLQTETLSKAGLNETLLFLRTLAEENAKKTPLICKGALNRIGDLYYDAREYDKAKEAYTEVLRRFPGLTSQTAAARLSLAEIYYREERFRRALDLYEKELSVRPFDDRIYQLARAGYIKKSILAGDYLFRVGEIPPAIKTFQELIDYDPDIVEAHRGLIKCAHAGGQIEPMIAKLEKRLQESPEDPVALYAAGLSLTYRNKKADMVRARNYIREAIKRNGQSEYFHQTLGYIDEMLETAYKEKNTLEKSLISYKKAYFLNNHEENPENAANLLLNMGNASFSLGRAQQAYSFYSDRLALNKPFDHVETEIQFYVKLGQASFLANKNTESVKAFQTALGLIDARLEKDQISDLFSETFDKLYRMGMDTTITTALKTPPFEKKAKALFNRMSGLNQALFAALQISSSPPDDSWPLFREKIEGLRGTEASISKDIAALYHDMAKKKKTNDQKLSAADLSLSFTSTLIRLEEMIRFPDRYIVFKTEILNRLGLAFQEEGNYREAIDTFQRLYSLTEKLKLDSNLALCQRNIALNTYFLAGKLSGEERRTSLASARDAFQSALILLDHHGIPKKKTLKKEGLISITADVALDDKSASQGAFGFSHAQEKRLCEAFLTRIHMEFDETRSALTRTESELKAYSEMDQIIPKEMHGVSLLYHKAGMLSFSENRMDRAFGCFGVSSALCVEMGTPVSSAINVANLARSLAEKERASNGEIHSDDRRKMISFDEKTSSMIDANIDYLDRIMAASYHNQVGVYLMPGVQGQKEGVEESVNRMVLLQKAVAHFRRGIEILEKKSPVQERNGFSLGAVLHLNLAQAASALGEREFAKHTYEKALRIAEAGMLPQFKWRALVGLGQSEEAFRVLETEISFLNGGCGPFEIISAFSDRVTGLVRGGEGESAFNLAETLSEMERFHRTAFLLNAMTPPQKSLLRQSYARLLTLRDIDARIQEASGEEKRLLMEEKSREQGLFSAKAGENLENMPGVIRSLSREDEPEIFMILMGIALHGEEIEDRIIRESRLTFADIEKGDGKTTGFSLKTGEESLTEERERLRTLYRSLLEETLSKRAADGKTGFLSLFTPERVEAIDVMGALPEGGRLLRLFPTCRADAPYIAFSLTPEEVSGRTIQSMASAGFKEPFSYIVTEDLQALPDPGSHPVALNSAHLLRSIANRKPFKKKIVSIPEPLPLPETGYEIVKEGDSITSVQTLLITESIVKSVTVPVREGEMALPLMAIQAKEGPRPHFVDQVKNLPGLSLAMATQNSALAQDVFLIAHLSAISGCPTLILPVVPKAEDPFIARFLSFYKDRSAMDAVSMAQADLSMGGRTASGKWMLLGFRGMSKEEAAAFAGEKFETYIKEGRSRFEAHEFDRARVSFENALSIAREMENFKPYLTPLLSLARESAYQEGDIQRAETFSGEYLARISSEKPDTEEHADALLRHGLILSRLEKYDQAIPAIEESLEIISNLEMDEKKTEALTSLGVVLEDATHYTMALENFESAARLLGSSGKKALLSDQYENIGRIWDLRLANYPKAIAAYEKALSIGQETGDREKIARALLNIGRCRRLTGNFMEASSLYDKAYARVKEDPPMKELACKIVIEKANNAWFQGRYQEAFTLEREALALARENTLPLLEIISLNTEGLIFWTLGEYDKALSSLNQALQAAKVFEKREDEIATTLNNIGLVLREKGELQNALDTFDQALQIDTRIGSRWAIGYDLRNKGLTLVKMGKPQEAVPLFEKALAESLAIGNKINAAKSLLGLAEALSLIGETEKAAKRYREAFDLSKRMALKETMWRSLYGLACINLKMGSAESLKKAERALYDAVAIIEGMRADILIDQLKDSFIENKLSVYETLIRHLADTGKEIAAFEMAERSRARNFIDLLGNQRLNLKNDIDQQLYDREASFRTRIESQEKILAAASDLKEREICQAALDKLVQERETLMTEIRVKNPELSTLVTVAPMDAKALVKMIDPGVVLLSYYLLPDEVLTWVIFPGETPETSIRLVRTPAGRSTLERDIFSYRRTIQNLEPYADSSQRLHRIFIDPVLDVMKQSGKAVRYLGIIPHGPAHYLSFATLFNGESFLSERYPLFYLPSASVLKFTKERRGKTKNLEVLAVGNPDLGNPALDLPFSEHEVETIRWNFPKITVLTRDKATESWIDQNISRFGIIHIASHGEFDPVNPLFSAIKLAKDQSYDGNLEAGEIFGLDIKADLVILSACQTGLGKITQGDDVVGLNRSFFYAGTHAVISSLWRVSDISTAILVKQFYRMYVKKNKAESLQSAILHVKESHPHPGYWGAFNLVGDYQ